MATPELKLSRTPTVEVGMLIRKPPADVFRAFADPAVTTNFWFTKSSGKLVPDAEVRWEWEMFDASTRLVVKEVDENRRIVFDWDLDDDPATVEFRFTPAPDETTYVQVTETGFSGDGDELVSRAADSTGGFTMVLCAAKALLEHDVILTVVRDRRPSGLEL
jgi:uncharacterized protein YndB with AHSA1/START domain